MNTLTQQQINQYQWRVADGAAVPVSPIPYNVLDENWVNKASELLPIIYHTNAPDGIYSGEAFELEDRCREPDFRFHQFLRLKPSHLPAVLTTQPEEEWKDRYSEVWYVQERGNLDWTKVTRRAIYDNYTFERYAALQFDKQDQATKREWHLNTPPTEQEAETVERSLAVQACAYIRKNYTGQFDGECDYNGSIDTVAHLMKGFVESILSQKDQRIAELENKWISVTIKEPELDSTIMIADLIMGGVAIMDYDEREQLQYFKYWMPLPNPPQH